MALLTLDASVWISAFTPGEPDHEASRTLVDELLEKRAPLVEPSLFLVEVAGAIARRRETRVALEVAQAVGDVPWIRWINLDIDLAGLALRLACEHHLRGADAVYAAVARTHAASLISLDQEHLTRLGTVVPTYSPSGALTQLRTT